MPPDDADKQEDEALVLQSRAQADGLAEKCRSFLALLDRFREYAVYLPIHSLIRRFLDETGQVRELPAEELALGYRTSVFESRPWCVLKARFALRAGDPAVIGAAMEDYMARRKAKQPLELPSAGSTFKRPVGAYAGALIDQCGLRGFRVGDAAISEKHCGFVVNLGQATCRDVLRLTDEVRRIVQEKTGFVLEKEIRVVR